MYLNLLSESRKEEKLGTYRLEYIIIKYVLQKHAIPTHNSNQ